MVEDCAGAVREVFVQEDLPVGGTDAEGFGRGGVDADEKTGDLIGRQAMGFVPVFQGGDRLGRVVREAADRGVDAAAMGTFGTGFFDQVAAKGALDHF